jgi:uridylate kinase
LKSELQLFVLKLSGSLFSSPDFSEVIATLAAALKSNSVMSLILIAGGGATARKYIQAGMKIGLDQATLDELGIESSRLNASLLREALRPFSSDKIPTDLRELSEEFAKTGGKTGSRILVCGGLHPGQSTNAVAALISEKTNANLLINATDVDGVYTKDPSRFADAKKLETVTPPRLLEILASESVAAGTYDLMDPVALKLISRSKIPTRIVKCASVSLSRVLNGKKEGTAIVFE